VKKLWIALILLMLCGCTQEPGREMILSVDLDGDGKAEQPMILAWEKVQ